MRRKIHALFRTLTRAAKREEVSSSLSEKVLADRILLALLFLLVIAMAIFKS